MKCPEEVFETPDIPELVGHVLFDHPSDREEETEEIDTTSIVPRQLFQHFAQQSFDYEKARLGNKLRESPTDTLRRLKSEIQTLQTQLLQTQPIDEENTIEVGSAFYQNVAENSTSQQLYQELRLLQQQLQTLLFADNKRIPIEDRQQQQAVYQKLLSDLETIKQSRREPFEQTPSEPSLSTTKTNAHSEGVIYELYCDLSVNSDQSKILNLEKRISKLEAIIGQTKGQNPNTAGPLVETINWLEKKISALDNERLDMLKLKILSLNESLDIALSSPPNVNPKINELYEVCTQWSDMASSVDAIARRLAKLKSVHERGWLSAETMNQMFQHQQQLQAQLELNSKEFQQLQQNFQMNLSIIQDNIQNLQSRFEKIEAKLKGQ